DARDRSAEELERIGQGRRRLPAAGARHVGPEVCGLYVRGIDARVRIGLERRVADELLVGAIVAIPELRTPDPADGGPVLPAAHPNRGLKQRPRISRAAPSRSSSGCRSLRSPGETSAPPARRP